MVKPKVISFTLHIGVISKIDVTLFYFVNIVLLADSLDDHFTYIHAFRVQMPKS